MIAVGCLTEFSTALDQRIYFRQSIPQDEQHEIEAAITRYRRFMTWFQERFFVVIEEEWINPTYIFHRCLVDFAATVIHYVKEQENDFHLGPIPRHTLTEVNMTKHFLNHFHEGYADLAETFLEMRQTASPRL
jgi:hypothetical protein